MTSLKWLQRAFKGKGWYQTLKLGNHQHEANLSTQGKPDKLMKQVRYYMTNAFSFIPHDKEGMVATLPKA